MDEDVVALEFAADVESAGASVRELADSATELAATSKEASEGVAGLGAPAAEAADGVREVATAATGATAELEAYKGAAAEAATASKELGDASAEAATAQKSSADAADSSAAKSEAASGGLGKYKTALVGVALGTALAVDGAAKFQAETTRLVTSAGESASNLNTVRQGMLAISSQTDTSTEQMAAGMYTIESAGFHGANGLTVLKAAAQGAKDEGAELSTVSNAVTDALVDFHRPASDAATVTSQLIAAVSHGKTTFEEFSSSMSNVLPLAAAMHLKLADVTGVLAEMTAHGMSAQRASMDMANGMRSLMNPTKTMVNEYGNLGISASQVSAHLGKDGLAGTMDWLSGVAKTGAGAIGQSYTQAMYKLMGTSPGLVTALMTTGENASATASAIKGISSASADAQGNVDGFSTVSKTASFQLGAAKQSIEAAGVSLGEVLLPSLVAVLRPITSLLQGIASNKAEAIAFAVVVGGVLAGALGVKLAGALKSAEEGIKAVGEGAGWLIGKLTGSTAATEAAAGAQEAQTAVTEASVAGTEAQATATEALTAAKEESVGATEAATVAQGELDVAMDANPIGLIIIVIIALIAVIVLIVTHLHTFAEAFDIVRHAVATAGHDIASVFDTMRHDIAAAVDAVVSFVEDHWKLLATVIATVLLGPVAGLVVFLATHWSQVTADVSKLYSDVTGFFKRIGTDVEKYSEEAVSRAEHTFEAGWDELRHDTAAGADDVLKYYVELPLKILAALAKLPGELETAGKNFVLGIIHGVENEASSLIGDVSNLAGDVEHAFTSALSIFSPSRVMFGHGVNFVQGIIDGVKSKADELKGTVRGLGTDIGSAGAVSAVAPVSGSTTVHVTVPTNIQGSTSSAYTDPQFEQYMQAQVQNAVLKYAELNPTNGLTPGWGR